MLSYPPILTCISWSWICESSAFDGWPSDLPDVSLFSNNEAADKTYSEDDTLFRGLLGLPQQPAVIRISVFALLFPDLARGTVSTLLMSQYFDVPVIGYTL